jgi:hypothetical protein
MKTEKMKVLLYLKKSGLDKSGKAPVMGASRFAGVWRSLAASCCAMQIYGIA